MKNNISLLALLAASVAWPLAAATPPPPPASSLQQASHALQAGAFQRAIGAYRPLLNSQNETTRATARLGMAAALAQAGRIAEAWQVLEGTVTNDTPLGQAIGQLRGQLLLQQADLAWWQQGPAAMQQALQVYDRLTLQPNPDYAHRLRDRLVPPSPGASPLQVAVLVPQTGPYAALGQTILQGLQVGLAQYQAQGAAQVEFKVYNTDASGGPLQAAQAALTEGAQVILGPLRAIEVETIAGAAQQAGVPILHFSTSVASQQPGVWGLVPGPDAQAAAAYQALKAAVVHPQVAALVPDNAYGRAALQGLQQAAGAEQEVRTAFYNPAVADVGSGIRTLLGVSASTAGLQGLLLPVPAKDVPLIASQLAYADLDRAGIKLLGTALWQNGLLLGPEGSVLRGAYMGVPGQAPELAKVYAQTFQAPKLPPLAAVAAGVTGVVTLLAQRAGHEMGLDLRTALTEPEGFYTPQGYIAFLPGGQTEFGLAASRLEEGVFRVVMSARPLRPVPLPATLTPSPTSPAWWQ